MKFKLQDTIYFNGTKCQIVAIRARHEVEHYEIIYYSSKRVKSVIASVPCELFDLQENHSQESQRALLKRNIPEVERVISEITELIYMVVTRPTNEQLVVRISSEKAPNKWECSYHFPAYNFIQNHEA